MLAFDDGVHGLADRHVDALLGRDPHDRGGGVDALRHRAAAAEHRVQRLPLAQRAAQAHVARLRAAAGQQQIAEAGQAHQRLGAGAQRLAEAAQLGKAARHQRRVRAGAEARALDDAGGDRQHVLDRAAELHADRIAGPVDAQVPVAERGGERLAQRLVRRWRG